MDNRIAKDAFVDENAKLGKNVVIGKHAIINGNADIGDHTFIGPFCIIGEPAMEYYKNEKYEMKKTAIGANSIIRSHTVIYENVQINEGFNTGHHVTIRENTKIGKKSSVGTLSDLQSDVNIGEYVRLHSNVFIGELTKIDDFVWIYPDVVITNDPYPPMGKLVGSHICKYAQIAAKAVILPGITIGENALVGAGSVVTKNVEKEMVMTGVPAKVMCSIFDIKDNDGNTIYPWKEHLTEYRGYPWQNE